MRIIFATISLLLIVSGCVSKPKTLPVFKGDNSLNNPAKSPEIVRLLDTAGDFRCTGTIIDTHYMLTAAHCVPTIVEATSLEDEPKNRAKITLVGTLRREDIAVFTGDFSAFNVMRINMKPLPTLIALQSSLPLLACGFPHGGDIFCERLGRTQQEYFQMESEGIVFAGMSGGPVYLEDYDVLIGIITEVSERNMVWSPTVEILKYLKIPVK